MKVNRKRVRPIDTQDHYESRRYCLLISAIDVETWLPVLFCPSLCIFPHHLYISFLDFVQQGMIIIMAIYIYSAATIQIYSTLLRCITSVMA